MSGTDPAELDRLVGTTNELFLSEEPKMVDVGGGVMRPTNAKVLADYDPDVRGNDLHQHGAWLGLVLKSMKLLVRLRPLISLNH